MTDYIAIAIGTIAAIMCMVYIIGVTKHIQQRNRENRRVNLAALRRQFYWTSLDEDTAIQDRQPSEDDTERRIYRGRVQ